MNCLLDCSLSSLHEEYEDCLLLYIPSCFSICNLFLSCWPEPLSWKSALLPFSYSIFCISGRHWMLIQWYMLIDTDRIWYWSQCVWVFCLFLQFRHCYCYWAPGFIQQRWATSLWRLRSVGTRWRFSRVSVQNSNTLNSVNECTHYARKSMLVHIYIYCIYSCHILTHYIASSLYIMI